MVGLWMRLAREVLLYIHIYIYVYSKTSLNRPTMGPLSGRFREVVDLGSSNICMDDPLGPK